MKKIVAVIMLLSFLLPLAAAAESNASEYNLSSVFTPAYSVATGKVSIAKQDDAPQEALENEISDSSSNNSEDTSETESGGEIWGNASGFDKFMIGFMFAILSFSALCMPIYVFLDFRKKREKRIEKLEKQAKEDYTDEEDGENEQ